MHQRIRASAGLCACIVLLCSCNPSEAPQVSLPVVVDGSAIGTATTDLGYTVELSAARIVVGDITFTVAGEAHTTGALRVGAVMRLLEDLLVPRAAAHPGHYQGGEATGELGGEYLLDFFAQDATTLGTATLIAGQYQGANFTFRLATAADGLASGDPLLGHTAHLVGQAKRGGKTINFSVVVDAPEGREMVGAEFDQAITASSSGALALRLRLADQLEGDTLFDEVDFEALDTDGTADVSLGPDSETDRAQEAHYAIRRALLAHDHYEVRLVHP